MGAAAWLEVWGERLGCPRAAEGLGPRQSSLSGWGSHHHHEWPCREGMSEGWMPAKGLREGSPTSPILFNIYHQAVMRQALEARGAKGREEKSVVWKWMPGSSFASERVRERGSGEAKEI